ncbi:hypothetical protein FJT64_004229 [Amphibalanus amphitrite]|uniref:Uncharacterized protein n=1 Tax=Amphibalanus amphitrite TaxID=1232801 RepID=A0A6A4VQ86_AMPAM|nr:hypothetical protein FJT64_004229 [Amphibalanus amphitrite]
MTLLMRTARGGRRLPLTAAAAAGSRAGGHTLGILDLRGRRRRQVENWGGRRQLDAQLLELQISKGVQSTRALPWERQASQTKLVDLLERMRVALVAQFKKTPTVSELLDVSEKEELWPSLLQNRATPPATEVAKVARYCSKLTERLQFRGRGQDKGGSQKGTSNGAIADSMDDIRCVADIQQVAVSNTPPQILARQVHEASMRLAGRKLVPLSSVPTARQIEAGIVLLRGHKARTSPELWKVLVDRRGGDPEARNYGNLVTRLWLVNPPESVVESMASVIGEVFGEHRQLDHTNAAAELIVRWNGPALSNAGRLIRSVQQRLSANNTFRCTRRTVSITQAFEGTVISRHKRAPDAKACVWKV